MLSSETPKILRTASYPSSVSPALIRTEIAPYTDDANYLHPVHGTSALNS